MRIAAVASKKGQRIGDIRVHCNAYGSVEVGSTESVASELPSARFRVLSGQTLRQEIRQKRPFRDQTGDSRIAGPRRGLT